MSNKVIFNLDELFISVGIDVGADFSWMSIALPNQQFVGKPFKILHNSIDSLTTAVSKIKEAEELYSLESRIFLESTGIYHYPLFCYLRDKGFNCSVINPIITKNSTNINIRKVHNDRFDSKKAALVGLKPDLKVSLMPSDLALNCRNLCREYYDLMDNRSAYVNKLQGELRMAFPQYLGIFSKVTINTSLTLLETYTSPSAFLEADKQEIIDIIKSTARFGLTYAQNKYNAIIQAATDANQFGYIIDSNIKRIRLYISFTMPDDKKVTFQNVAGLEEEKEELKEVVDFLKDPQKYTKVGARIPKGVILVGPPGTGKTLLAKAVAGEAGVPFFSISGSDFVEMFVGVGASRVRDLFEEGKRHAPCIIFIDEIDAVARQRGTGMGGGHDEREQTLNQLLVEMDGFGVNEGIIVMAATNRVDILDPAILRPGRFDRKVGVGRPDIKGREEILHVHAKDKPLGEDVDLKQIAQTTAGFTGADLENLMNEAAIAAARKGHVFIRQKDIKNAFIKVGIGAEKKSKVISEKEKRITAYHEAGRWRSHCQQRLSFRAPGADGQGHGKVR